MKKFIPTIIFTISAVIFFAWLFLPLYLSIQEQNYKHQYETQQICDRSHVTVNGSLEKACGEVQDKYNTEYLCNGLKVDSFCWVEVK